MRGPFSTQQTGPTGLSLMNLEPERENQFKMEEPVKVDLLGHVEITLQDVNDNPPVFPNDILDLTVEENIGDGFKIMQLTATDADEKVPSPLLHMFPHPSTKGSLTSLRRFPHLPSIKGSLTSLRRFPHLPSTKGSLTSLRRFPHLPFTKGSLTSSLTSPPLKVPSPPSEADHEKVLDGPGPGGPLQLPRLRSDIYTSERRQLPENTVLSSVSQGDCGARDQPAALPTSPHRELELEPTSPRRELELEPTSPHRELELEELELEPTSPHRELELEPTSPHRELELEPTSPRRELELEPTSPRWELELEPTSPRRELELEPTSPHLQSLEDGKAAPGGPCVSRRLDAFTLPGVLLASFMEKLNLPPSSKTKRNVFKVRPAVRRVESPKCRGPNALVTYTIVSGADDSFRVDPESGDLVATRRLDRERRSEYSLLVRADDGRQSSDMRLNITVSDLNDHAPLFSRAGYSFDLPEDTAPGSIVAAILASDPDLGLSGETQRFHVLTARARDGGGRVSRVRVYFNVLDVNDNAPVFQDSAYSRSVSEDLPPGASVVTLTATDADDGVNGQLRYSVVSGDPRGSFNVTEDGVLRTAGPLDRETRSFYNLVVAAHDLAPPPAPRFSATARVSVILLDVNDCAPVFASTRRRVAYVRENTPPDALVLTVRAADADSGPNSYVEYSLAEGPFGSKFRIGAADGEVRLAGELDREELAEYTLTVVATDKGSPPLSAATEVTVTVLDVNDNTPAFSRNVYDAEIAEDTLTGADVLRVSASDADEGSNGQIRFSVAAGDGGGAFRVDSVTGVISVARRLDREARASYSLTVQASDRGSVPRVDRATVNIVLLDVNDCAPAFELSPYTVSAPENLENLPLNILQVVARDDDQGANGQLSYMLSGGIDDAAFSLSSSGQLSLTQKPDRELQDKYVLLVTATDSGEM
ncbi:hypothetical protein NHX12_011281 [Muraenolepis orangiensis]|uniref:Cadherin domain-containing protein n=1 Tax=Muraenolepis orangiensis TaxID=630683 RepID=A0A9Q0DFW7_9TELE|nr:hypothetical protein NHX12_011281 [Muraenolepis orangiensis]